MNYSPYSMLRHENNIYVFSPPDFIFHHILHIGYYFNIQFIFINILFNFIKNKDCSIIVYKLLNYLIVKFIILVTLRADKNIKNIKKIFTASSIFYYELSLYIKKYFR